MENVAHFLSNSTTQMPDRCALVGSDGCYFVSRQVGASDIDAAIRPDWARAQCQTDRVRKGGRAEPSGTTRNLHKVLEGIGLLIWAA